MAGRSEHEVPEDEEILIHPDTGAAVSLSTEEVILRGGNLTQQTDQTQKLKERDRKRIFRRVFKTLEMREVSLDALIDPYLQDVGRDSDRPTDLQQLYIFMEQKGKLTDLFALQSYLIKAGQDGVSNELADLAKSSMLSEEVNIRHFSKEIPEDTTNANAPKREKEEISEPPLKKPKMNPHAGSVSKVSEVESTPPYTENGPRHQWAHWEKIDVLRYFNECSLPKAVIALSKLDFTGKDLASWNLSLLMEKGLKDDVAEKIMVELAKLQTYRESVPTKLIQDCVHGPMDFHPLCVKIMDTPEFQRLRNIKQLGSVYLVYPGAAHNRFEHSLGVGFLTSGFVKSLKARQPELGINEVDVMCVTIAGLCHDLGQGPHSRLFEEFMNAAEKNTKWKHEDAAYMMFDHLIEKNDLRPEMFRYGLTETDIQFIREQVRGKAGDKEIYRGRIGKKSFLYEIVAQSQNGVDVNKWDYIARDSLMLGMPNSFDYRRFIMHARAIETEGGYRLCARDKDADDHYKMFQSRYSLGRRAYFHKVHQSIEAMLVDVMLYANSSTSIRYTDKYRERVCLSGCAYDPVAFTKVTDSIFDVVELSTSSDLQGARDILENIRFRRFYKMVSETEPTHTNIPVDGLAQKISPSNRVSVKKAYLDYGLKDRDPIEKMLFYRKGDPKAAVNVSKAQVSVILPEKFPECIIRVYCKDADEKSMRNCATAFEKWCTQRALRPKMYRK